MLTKNQKAEFVVREFDRILNDAIYKPEPIGILIGVAISVIGIALLVLMFLC